MNQPTFSESRHTPTFERNLAALKKQQPHLAERLAALQDNGSVKVVKSKDNLPVPVLNDIPLHSLDSPVAEARQIVRMIDERLNDPRFSDAKLPFQRLIFFGLGFGYHLMPLIQKGMSVIVVEPDAQLFYQAFSYMDFTETMPFIHFHLVEKTDDLPDIPRMTQVFFHPVMEHLFPQFAIALSQKIIVDYPARTNDMHEGVYYGSYRNVICLKNPVDLFVYQMLFYLIRPTLVIEIGACRGGSALYFADLLRQLGGNRHVYSYDIVDQIAPEVRHDPDITFNFNGWVAFDPSIIKPNDRVIICEDSSHTYENTIQVLRKFAPYVSPNSYFLVEDGEVGYTRPEFHGGPTKAIEEFMAETNDFELDRRWEFLYGNGISECLKGYLRKKASH